MRLLYVINGLGTGGAERSLAELLPYLEDAGIRATIAAFEQGREGVESAVVESGADVRFLRGTGVRARVRELRRLISDHRPDLVQTTHFEADITGRLAARQSGSPVLTSLVNTPYDPVRRRDPSVPGMRLLAARAIDTWTARTMTSHFHAITHAVKQAAVERMRIPPQRITVVERGRDAVRLGSPGADRRRRVRASIGIGPEDSVILNAGRREFQKGQRYLIEAVDALAAEGRSVVLLFAGRDGLASADLERRRAASRYPDRVRFLGHRNDVPDLLAAADLFVFPSLYEGLGCSVIEAMALGLPVVASSIAALEGVVEHERSGLLVPRADPAALATAIRTLLDDRMTAARMGARGRAIFDLRFRLEDSATRMIDLYVRLAGRRSVSARSG